MIKFKTVRRDGMITGFTVTGHSGLAQKGNDIVCAAVSAAVWMTINGIERQHLAQISYKQEDGFVECSISETRDAAADALLNSLVYTMTELSAQYKKYIFMTQV